MIVPKYHIDLMYMNQISHRLLKFKKANGVYTCRCPLCGDSKTSSKKTRFYFYTKKNNLNTICHNCGHSSSFWNFLKQFDTVTFEEYKKETMLDCFKQSPKRQEAKPATRPTLKPPVTQFKQLEHCVSMLALDESHNALKYVLERGFDKDMIGRLYYTDDFKKVASSINAESANNLSDTPEARIVIPFYDKDDNITLIQGRSLKKNSKLKYITIKTHDDVPKIYGLEKLDKSKTVYCCEGPFDSMFIDNCVATCDGNLLAYSDADVFVIDNQPRNEAVVKMAERIIDAGKSVVIWPNSPQTKQDINDLILMGISKDELMEVIKLRTFSGIRAKVELSKWKKI